MEKVPCYIAYLFKCLVTTQDDIKINNLLINTREHICNQMVYINEAYGEHFVHEFSSSWSGAITHIKPPVIHLRSPVLVFQKALSYIKHYFSCFERDACKMVQNFHIGSHI